MRRRTKAQPPWPNADFGMPDDGYAIPLADIIRIVADYLTEAAGICTAKGSHLDPVILVSFAQENSPFFKMLHDVAQQVDLYHLPEFSDQVAESVDRWNALVRDSSS